MTGTDQGLWSRWGANAGGTFFVDVAPLASPPKVLWARTHSGANLLGSERAPVVVDRGPALLLDRDTGEALAAPREAEAEIDRIILTGEALWVPRSTGLSAYAVPSGEPLWTFAGTAGAECVAWAPGTLVTSDQHTLRAWHLSGDAAQPALDPTWTATPSGGQELAELFLAGEQVVTNLRSGETVAFDRATGQQRWRREGATAMLDAEGAIVYARDRTWALIDRDGRERWADRSRRIARALAPGFVVCEPPPGDPRLRGSARLAALVLDRAKGELLGQVPLVGAAVVCAATPKVLYGRASSDTVGAWSPDGRALWTVRIPRLKWEINQLVPTPGRLYGLSGNGRVFCLATD